VHVTNECQPLTSTPHSSISSLHPRPLFRPIHLQAGHTDWHPPCPSAGHLSLSLHASRERKRPPPHPLSLGCASPPPPPAHLPLHASWRCRRDFPPPVLHHKGELLFFAFFLLYYELRRICHQPVCMLASGSDPQQPPTLRQHHDATPVQLYVAMTHDPSTACLPPYPPCSAPPFPIRATSLVPPPCALHPATTSPGSPMCKSEPWRCPPLLPPSQSACKPRAHDAEAPRLRANAEGKGAKGAKGQCDRVRVRGGAVHNCREMVAH
jgi:hypothetical protein